MSQVIRDTGMLTICVDVGGTFTDLVLADSSGALLATEKVLTTPSALATGAMHGIKQLLKRGDVEPGVVSMVIHATTQTSNTLIERSGARTALITTAGFRDILELARESRYDVYDLFIKLPVPLIPRNRRFEVVERVAADGQIYHPLDADVLRGLARQLTADNIESVAVCLLHAYRNPEHEQTVRATFRDAGFDGAIVLSSDVCPEIREYERSTTTAANAYLYPRMAAYLRDFEIRLRDEGILAPLRLFSSYGGRMTPAAAQRRPVEMLECGAAAGVLVAAATARQLQWDLAMSFDMGGTTAKAAVIKAGRPQLASSYEVARLARFTPGSGLPIAASAVDVIEIGAGGGSIVALDQMGLITVGPESASSEPGPACYGRGGLRPTVADADLVLGYLDPNNFAADALTLDADAARFAIERAIATPLSRSVEDAAAAIHEIVVEQMSRAARLHAVALGYDPRKLRIIAFGGAGPMHACAVAARLGAPEVVVILDAGVGAAVGLALAPTVCAVARSRLCPLHEINWPEIEALIADMQSEVLADIDVAETTADMEWLVSCDMRYRGQGYEINIPFWLPPYGLDTSDDLNKAFSDTYRERYGRDNPGVASEIVSWRLEARSGGLFAPKPSLFTAPVADIRKATVKTRQVRFEREFVEVPVYQRNVLEAGTAKSGPALVVEPNTTTVITPGTSFSVDDYGNLRILMQGGS